MIEMWIEIGEQQVIGDPDEAISEPGVATAGGGGGGGAGD